MGNRNIKNNDRTSRRGGKKRGNHTDVRIIVTSVYVGEKPMKDAIGNAITDSLARKEERDEITA